MLMLGAKLLPQGREVYFVAHRVHFRGARFMRGLYFTPRKVYAMLILSRETASLGPRGLVFSTNGAIYGRRVHLRAHTIHFRTSRLYLSARRLYLRAHMVHFGAGGVLGRAGFILRRSGIISGCAVFILGRQAASLGPRGLLF